MKKVLWILMVFVVACSSSSPGEYIEPADEDNGVFEVECTKHEDCYPEHTFCVKGLCTGEPQPENLPAGEDASVGVSEDATESNAPVEPQGSPWGKVNYNNKDAGASDDTAVENADSATGPDEVQTEEIEPEEEVIICLEDADCADGDANTWDYCIGVECLNVVGVSNEPECVASDEVCDGLDNDCDGETDEGVLNACGKCGDVPVEVCDGLDNDCDGETDESVLNACGKCGATPYEYCNGLDDDCDGAVDEVCACLPNVEQKCTTTDFVYYEIGECKYGTQKCISGNWGVCVGAVEPVVETCDGLDNDCDGATDNGVLKPDGSCADCLSDTDCPSGGGCNCTENGNVLCVGTTGKCLFGECQTGEVETKCQFGCANSECLQCLSNSDCDDTNLCTKDKCLNGKCDSSDNKCVSYGGEVGIMLTCEDDEDCQGSGFGDYCVGPDGPYEFKHCFPCINASYQYVACDDPDQVCTWQAVATATSSEDQIYLMKFECVTPACTNASNDFTCDDGDICTNDYCNYPYSCAHTQIKNCVKCETDADCVEETFCDEQNGGVYVRSGLCFKPFGGDGSCDINYYTDMDYSLEQGCAPPIECADEEYCPSGGSCVNWQCYYENGQYPIQKYMCAFYCPASTGTAVVWHGNGTDYLKAGMPLQMTSSELCSWGWGKPSLKFNCWDGGAWWGNGQMAEVICTAPEYTIKPDVNLGNQGVMVLQFEEVCNY